MDSMASADHPAALAFRPSRSGRLVLSFGKRMGAPRGLGYYLGWAGLARVALSWFHLVVLGSIESTLGLPFGLHLTWCQGHRYTRHGGEQVDNRAQQDNDWSLELQGGWADILSKVDG